MIVSFFGSLLLAAAGAPAAPCQYVEDAKQISCKGTVSLDQILPILNEHNVKQLRVLGACTKAKTFGGDLSGDITKMVQTLEGMGYDRVGRSPSEIVMACPAKA